MTQNADNQIVATPPRFYNRLRLSAFEAALLHTASPFCSQGIRCTLYRFTHAHHKVVVMLQDTHFVNL